jgi:hypothetical protein
LVQAALKSELAGDAQRRDALLRQALEQSPNDAMVNWQLGRLRVQGKWKSPAEVEQAAQGDQRLAQYRRMRDEAQPTAEGQATLARWCRKNRLTDEERVHWLIVLQLEPGNAEAIAAMKLQPYLGTLMTPEQIERVKRETYEIAKAAERWRPLVAGWQNATEHGNAALTTEMQTKLAASSSAAELLGLEKTLWHQVGIKRRQETYRSMLRAMMPALGENPHPAAAASLARSAVFADFDDVRAAAIAGLKQHPLDHYAMLLLGSLQSLLEAKAEVHGQFNSVTLDCSVYQEGALADLSFSHSLIVSRGGPENAILTAGEGGAGQADVDAQNRVLRANAERTAVGNQFQQAASDFYDTVERANQQIAQRNVRITAALGELTGQKLGEEPMKWWKWWWQDYNESYEVISRSESDPADYERKPVYSSSTSEYYRLPHSCFAPGTKVWTMTGRQPIEAIKIGDRVLAQDVESGELAYKPVLAVTVRSAGSWMKICLGTHAEELTTTPSHPFWVAGEGWRMTKQLEAGNRVDSLAGGVPVESVETLKADTSSPAFAYNLIVADFNSYFVGDQGILVHDNTPRMPTAAILPGLAKRDTWP